MTKTFIILLFGKDPQQYFQRARTRFIRYDGTESMVGSEMNVVKDKIFTGRILDIVEKTLAFVRGQTKEHTCLEKDGKFVTTPEFPEVIWKEIIINADYCGIPLILISIRHKNYKFFSILLW